jgi:hypothetical protein
MIMHNLFENNWLMKGNPGKRLTIAMDNCGGENKNNHALRLSAYLVEMKYFEEVEFIFYVRGHTKSACDRTFNQMKLHFHRQDIFTYGQAVEALGKQENITMIDATEGMFKNYGALLDKYYNSFKTGTIQKNHVFRVTNGEPSMNIQCSTHDGAEFMMQPMLKRGVALSDKRFEEIQDFFLQTLKPPCLRPIKQIELYKKFRPYVPRQY